MDRNHKSLREDHDGLHNLIGKMVGSHPKGKDSVHHVDNENSAHNLTKGNEPRGIIVHKIMTNNSDIVLTHDLRVFRMLVTIS